MCALVLCARATQSPAGGHEVSRSFFPFWLRQLIFFSRRRRLQPLVFRALTEHMVALDRHRSRRSKALAVRHERLAAARDATRRAIDALVTGVMPPLLDACYLAYASAQVSRLDFTAFSSSTHILTT